MLPTNNRTETGIIKALTENTVTLDNGHVFELAQPGSGSAHHIGDSVEISYETPDETGPERHTAVILPNHPSHV